MEAADWSAKRASQLSFFPLLPHHLGFNLVSVAAAATILCVPNRLHHQRVYLLKVSVRNHNHMRSTQLLRLQAYTQREGPQPRSQKCLFLRPCKAWFLAKRSVLFWTCCTQCRRNTARHTRQQHLGTVSGPCLHIWQRNSD